MTEEELAAKLMCAEIERSGLSYYMHNGVATQQSQALVIDAKALARLFFGR